MFNRLPVLNLNPGSGYRSTQRNDVIPLMWVPKRVNVDPLPDELRRFCKRVVDVERSDADAKAALAGAAHVLCWLVLGEC